MPMKIFLKKDLKYSIFIQYFQLGFVIVKFIDLGCDDHSGQYHMDCETSSGTG